MQASADKQPAADDIMVALLTHTAAAARSYAWVPWRSITVASAAAAASQSNLCGAAASSPQREHAKDGAAEPLQRQVWMCHS